MRPENTRRLRLRFGSLAITKTAGTGWKCVIGIFMGKNFMRRSAGLNQQKEYNDWWLRSPGEGRNKAAYIDGYGIICRGGTDIRNGTLGICPVIWIDLSVE